MSPGPASAVLKPTRPFAAEAMAPSVAADPGERAGLGHDLGRIAVSAAAGGDGAPIQRMPKKHHDIRKDKSQPKKLRQQLHEKSARERQLMAAGVPKAQAAAQAAAKMKDDKKSNK